MIFLILKYWGSIPVSATNYLPLKPAIAAGFAFARKPSSRYSRSTLYRSPCVRCIRYLSKNGFKRSATVTNIHVKLLPALYIPRPINCANRDDKPEHHVKAVRILAGCCEQQHCAEHRQNYFQDSFARFIIVPRLPGFPFYRFLKLVGALRTPLLKLPAMR